MLNFRASKPWVRGGSGTPGPPLDPHLFFADELCVFFADELCVSLKRTNSRHYHSLTNYSQL